MQKVARLPLFLSLVLLLAACSSMVEPPLEGLETLNARGTICHYQEDEGSWKLLNVGAKAAAKHLQNHRDDGVPGGRVRNVDNSFFDASCRFIIDGSVVISDWNPDEGFGASQVNLNAIAGVAEIRGGLHFYDIGMNLDFSPLDHLEIVEQELAFLYNTGITTLSGFNALRSIGGLRVYDSIPLASISGFNALTTVTNKLEITYNPYLTSISGFSALHRVGGDFVIDNNARLTGISGFDSLLEVGGEFYTPYGPCLGLFCAE